MYRLLWLVCVLVIVVWALLSMQAWINRDGEELNRLGVLIIAAAMPLFLSLKWQSDDLHARLAELEIKNWAEMKFGIETSVKSNRSSLSNDFKILQKRLAKTKREITLSEIFLVVVGTIQTGFGNLVMEKLT